MVPPQLLPVDLNAELLLAYLRKGVCKVALRGLHKRNTYRDIIRTDSLNDESFLLTVGRNSIYNSLPEYMFHPIDRFDNLPKYEEKERFAQQLDEQKEEIENAFRFFAPVDILLIWLRTQVRTKVEKYAKEDVVMQQILGDSLTEAQRENRFIRQLLPYLPYCKHIRGNKTLLTILLRKVFMSEGLTIRVSREQQSLTDEESRYENQLDMTLGESYVGNVYDEAVTTYDISYWSDEACDADFLKFVDEVEVLRLFIQDYLLSVEEVLRFNIVHDGEPLRLNDDVEYNYLNYNTNI